MDKIIAGRLGKRTIGFGQSNSVEAEADLAELLPQIDSDDILEFGLIPELVGRLPVISSLGPLSAEALVRVLLEPRNALVKQYQKLFEMESCKLEFTDDALLAIARRALKKETGARGLRSIMEDVMLDVMFDLPDNTGSSYLIEAAHVDEKQPILPVPAARPKSA